MFRAKQRGDGDPFHFVEYIDDVLAAGVYCGVIGDDAHPLSPKQLGVFLNIVQSREHPGMGRGFTTKQDKHCQKQQK